MTGFGVEDNVTGVEDSVTVPVLEDSETVFEDN